MSKRGNITKNIIGGSSRGKRNTFSNNNGDDDGEDSTKQTPPSIRLNSDIDDDNVDEEDDDEEESSSFIDDDDDEDYVPGEGEEDETSSSEEEEILREEGEEALREELDEQDDEDDEEDDFYYQIPSDKEDIDAPPVLDDNEVVLPDDELILMELEGEDSNILYNTDYVLLGLDTSEPILRVGNTLFKGKYESVFGTQLFFKNVKKKSVLSPIPLDDQSEGANKIEPSILSNDISSLYYINKTQRRLIFKRVNLERRPEFRERQKPIEKEVEEENVIAIDQNNQNNNNNTNNNQNNNDENDNPNNNNNPDSNDKHIGEPINV